MKVSIEKQLEKSKGNEIKKFNVDPINEVKLLLNGDETEDLRILRGLSNNSQFAKIETLHGKQLELEKLEGLYEGKVFTRNQIKDLAVNYKLRFLRAKYYTGSFDREVAGKIKEFAKNTNSPVDNWSLQENYYILAPENNFNLKEKIHIYKKELDPAIFYKIDDNHFRLIHKWGSDFTILRLLNGFRWKNFMSHWLFNTAMVLPFMCLIFAVILPVAFVSSFPLLFCTITFIASVIVAHLVWGQAKIDDWDIIKGCFTPHNWDTDTKLKTN